MRKSILNTLKSLETQLSKIHPIVDLLEKKSNASSKELRDWLAETEELFKQNNLAESSMFAVKRGELSTYHPENSQHKRKQLLQFCSGLLTDAQGDLWKVYARLTDTIEKAKVSVKQLLGVIYQTKQFKYDPGTDFTQFIHEVWQFCTIHEQLRGITAQIQSLVTKTDVLLLLAEEIEIENL